MNVVSMLKYGDKTLRSAYENISSENWDIKNATGFWSVKDIVSHLTSWELVLGDVLSTFTDGGPTPHLDEVGRIRGKFNDAEVEIRQSMSSEEVTAEYEAAHARVLALAAKVEPELFRKNGTLPWYGEEYCLDDFIVFVNYAHKREHAAEINLYRDQVEH